MKKISGLVLLLAGMLPTVGGVAPAAQTQPSLPVAIPKPGVPEVLTIEGKFVRAAYNNEGYVILGYQPANRSIGEEWLLLEIGATLRDNVPDFKLLRGALSLDTPDGKTLPLPTVSEFRAGNTQALQNRAKVQRDSINYFPPGASRTSRLGFFSDLEDRAMAWDEVELSNNRACVGRIYFKVPGGIKYGQYFLNVKFAKSLIRVPFRILTAEEEKFLGQNFKAIDKQVEEAFRPAKK